MQASMACLTCRTHDDVTSSAGAVALHSDFPNSETANPGISMESSDSPESIVDVAPCIAAPLVIRLSMPLGVRISALGCRALESKPKAQRLAAPQLDSQFSEGAPRRLAVSGIPRTA